MKRLWLLALFSVCGVYAGVLLALTAPASAAINTQISFQGKLTNTDGTNVTDGTYSIRFRIYTDPSADTGACANTCKWEETQGSVSVASGLFHVDLGSSTSLPGSVDFNASALYLGVKVGSDAEMTPRIRLTAAPQAFNSDLLDGLDSAAFGQLAGSQTWTGANTLQPTTNITGLTVKQTSAGSPTADIFNVQTANTTSIIQVTGPAANEAAVTIGSVGATRNLTLNSGSGTIVLGASILSRTAAGTTTINLVDGSNTLLSVTNTGAGTASINVDGGYQVGGTPGSSVTCSGGQFLQNQVVNGGITTGGSCAAASSSNSFSTIDTPAGTDPVADSATDTLQLLVSGTNLTITGTDNTESVTFNVVESALAGNGLVANGDALDINTGNGLTLSSDAITINLPTATDALSATTSSGSGLQLLTQGLTLLQGCADTQILKWNETSDVWACAADATSGTTPDFDAIYAQSITGTNLNMEIDDTGGLTFDLTTTGDFAIRDGTTAFATFDDSGGITLAPNGTSDFTINQAAGVTTQIVATAAPTVDQLTITNSGQASATSGVDGLQITFGAAGASGSALHLTPSYAGGATDALTYNGLEIDGFSPTNAAGTDTVNGIKIGNLTDPGATITSTGLQIGTGWDVGLKIDSGEIVTSNEGVEFTESDTNPACAAGNYSIFADLSETKLKKCVNGTVSDIDAGTKYEAFTADGTYTKPADAVMVIVEMWGGGGGGGGGAGGSNAAARTGGGGGGGGAYVTGSFLASNLASSVPVTVGTGGSAGSAGANSVGGNGGAGGSSCFSTTTACAGTMYLRAYGGGFGAGSGAAGNGGGGGGGSQSAGGNASTVTFGAGGGPLAVAAASGVANSGDGGGNGGTAAAAAAAGGSSNFGGGGGGSSTTAGAGNSGGGGAGVRGGGGGAGGGSCAITTCTVRTGGGGGATGGGIVSGGTAGSGAGGGGGAGGTGTTNYGGGGGGGGASSNTGAGGPGGAGGTLGGGGGGGGGAHTGSTNGGAGAAGGRGEARVWTIRGSGADLAEIYGTKEDLKPGDVVCADASLRAGVKKCTKQYDKGALGVITTSPGLVIGDVEDVDVKTAPVVLAGRTPIRVSTENGFIKPGDFLTPSSVPGVAMKATKAGQIIGQALGPFESEGIGMTMIFVKTSFGQGSSPASLAAADPGADTARQTLAYLTNEQQTLAAPTDLSEIFTDRLVAGLEVTTPKVTADTIRTNTLTATSDDLAIKLTDNGQLAVVNALGDKIFTVNKETAATQLDLAVAAGLTVGGTAKFTGNAFFYKLVTFTQKTVFGNDIRLDGHIQTGGGTPIVTLEAAAGLTAAPADVPNTPLATASVSGNDTAGALTFQLGSGALPGKALSVTFTKHFDKTPRILLTPSNTAAADSKYYVESTPAGFSISLTGPPDPGTPLTLNYWVVE